MKSVFVLLALLFASNCEAKRYDKYDENWERKAIMAMYASTMAIEKSQYSLVRSNGIMDEVCYENVGCFNLQDGELRHVGMLPLGPRVIEPKLLLYSSRLPINSSLKLDIDFINSEEFSSTETQMFLSRAFMTDDPLMIVAHGFGESAQREWVHDMKNALLNHYGGSVMLLDWRRGAALPLYYQAVANTELVGRYVAEVLIRLMKLYPQAVLPERIHFIGFSLGAQLGGFMGRWFSLRVPGKRIHRLTCLDTASPLFERYRVLPQVTDADHVEAIHTSAGESIITGKVGVVVPFGDVDFYPNGGASQPGCGFFGLFCHHQRAHQYYIEALRNTRYSDCSFKSVSCQEDLKKLQKNECTPQVNIYGEMGPRAHRSPGQQIQYLQTNPQPPYCRRVDNYIQKRFLLL